MDSNFQIRKCNINRDAAWMTLPGRGCVLEELGRSIWGLARDEAKRWKRCYTIVVYTAISKSTGVGFISSIHPIKKVSTIQSQNISLQKPEAISCKNNLVLSDSKRFLDSLYCLAHQLPVWPIIRGHTKRTNRMWARPTQPMHCRKLWRVIYSACYKMVVYYHPGRHLYQFLPNANELHEYHQKNVVREPIYLAYLVLYFC